MIKTALLTTLLALSAQAESPVPAADQPLVRWQGGQLDRETFRQRYDPEGKALAAGGEELEALACKATFLEIFGAKAAAAKLDSDPEIVAELAVKRRKLLAALYRRQNEPSPGLPIDPADVRTFYDQHKDRFKPSTKADLEVLHLRCGLRSAERATCRARAAALDARLAAGEALAALALEEKSRSSANGSFADVELKSLNKGLEKVVEATVDGGSTPWVELPHGLFKVRVNAKKVGGILPFEQVEGVVRAEVVKSRVEAWTLGERQRLKVAGEIPFEEVLAQAAIAAGFEKDPTFLRYESEGRRWVLADRAFAREESLWPDAAQLATARAALGEALRQVRLLVGVLAIGHDQALAFERAGRLADLLDLSKDPLSTLRQAPELFPGLELEEFETKANNLSILPILDQALKGVASGQIKGPIPLPVRQIASILAGQVSFETRDLAALAFVGLLEARPASDAELRDELMRQRRSRLGAGPAAFKAELGVAFGLEFFLGPP